MTTVEVHTPVSSATHYSFAIVCPPYGEIQQETRPGGALVHTLHGQFEVGEHYMLECWPVIDAFLAALSLVGDGVFSREIWTKRSNYSDARSLGPMPQELRVPAGWITVSLNRPMTADDVAVVAAFERIRDRVASDPDALTVLTYYTVSNWLLNADLVREAGMNYFSVVEAVLTRLTNQPPGDALWGKKTLTDAAQQVGIDAAGVAAIGAAADVRNNLAHGRLEHLIHSQYTLGSQPATSPSLRLPALECKEAADVVLRRYFGL